jgi:hypothetical protein
MTSNSEQRTHEWWKDRSDSTQTAAVSELFAAKQKDSYCAGWRRNMMLAFVVCGCLYLLKMIAAG